MEADKIWSNYGGWIGIHKQKDKKRTVIVIGEHGCLHGEPIAQFLDGDGMNSGGKAKWFARHIVKMLNNEPRTNRG